MPNLIINGGKKLTGEIRTNSAKNSAVAILCSLPIIKGKTTLLGVPRIEEVNRIIETLTSIGLKIKWTGAHKLEIITPAKLNLKLINQVAYGRTRSAILLIGSLSNLYKNFSLPKTSGCKLGKRSVNPHIFALNHLGIVVKATGHGFSVLNKQTKNADFPLYESGDTVTENAILAAVLKPGKTFIHLASSNYMVQDLCHFLNKAGAKIKNIGTTELEIIGVKKLKPIKGYTIMPDPIESMAFISMAIATNSSLKITRCPIDFLRLELEKLRVMGQKIKISKKYKFKNGRFDLVDLKIIPSKINALPDKIYARPFPGLNIDNLPLFVPILMKAKGESLLLDWVYESRTQYYTLLNKLGGKIKRLDPHRVVINGPTKFKPAKIKCPPALRPAINLLICALAASGQSVIYDSYSIDRGYENICQRLYQLGADIIKTK